VTSILVRVSDDKGPGNELGSSAAVLRAGLAMSELDVQQLWVAYVTLGGSMTPPELHEVLRGERDISGYEHDLLTQALNDDFTSRGQDQGTRHH
jgi:hypothetical protein